MTTYKNMMTKCYELYTDLSKKPESTFATMREAINYGNNMNLTEFYVQEKLFSCHKKKEDINEKTNEKK